MLAQVTRARSVQEAEADRVSAWRHGLVSDGSLEWGRRCLQVAQYAVDHGDAHIGYRDHEDSDLVRWARKQRHAYKQQTLSADRYCVFLSVTVTCLVRVSPFTIPAMLWCAVLCHALPCPALPCCPAPPRPAPPCPALPCLALPETFCRPAGQVSSSSWALSLTTRRPSGCAGSMKPSCIVCRRGTAARARSPLARPLS